MSANRSSQPELLTALVCPQCGAPVKVDDSQCPRCGVDLALAAALAERQVLTALPALPGVPYVADVILPRFGEFLLKNGYIAEAQLETALARQRERAATGQKPTIGQVLLEMGAVTRTQLDLVSIQQLQQLQNALQANNRRLEQCVAEEREELRRALQKLTELNELKFNFITTIRHELRTPLSHIKGYGDLLSRGTLGALNDEQREAVGIMARATTHLERLINDLLRFTSSAKGELTLNRTPLALASLIERVLEISAAKATQGQVQLRSEVPPDLPPVVADEEKLHWVLFQLVDNAIKFTPADGAVTLAAEARDRGVRLSVRDTGIGIPPERLSEIFQPFHQLDGSSTRPYGGMGLGLALVRHIVEAHGSQVEVDSQPGRGSQFSFELPLADSDGQA